MAHAIFQLREATLPTCTRPFKARGSIVKRCPNCLLAQFACLCAWQLQRQTPIHFLIIIHRKELFKSTNTGRLIADLFPDSTSAYLWSRTEPDPELLAAISNPERRCVLLFPENDSSDTPNSLPTDAASVSTNTSADAPANKDTRPLTVILLDGTWKQAARMANLSGWLQDIPRLSIQTETALPEAKQAYIRKAQHQHQVSTAQAAACVLREQGDNENATLLEHYFSVFNQHCIATRRNTAPTLTDAHHALEQAKHHDTRC